MTTAASVCPTLREALNRSAYGGGRLAKLLAAELDWSPSEFTMRVTIGGDSARHFPANDEAERLPRLMQLTGDYSYLATLADKLGFELKPKPERTAEEVSALRADLQAFGKRIEQLSLDLGQGSRRR